RLLQVDAGSRLDIHKTVGHQTFSLPLCPRAFWWRTERRGAGGASVSVVVVIGSTSRRRVPGDGLGRQRYGRAPRLCSALPSPPGTCGKPPGSLLLLGVGRLLGGKPSSVLLLGVRSRSPVVHPLHNVLPAHVLVTRHVLIGGHSVSPREGRCPAGGLSGSAGHRQGEVDQMRS